MSIRGSGVSARQSQLPNAASSTRASPTPAFCNCAFTTGSFAARSSAPMVTLPAGMLQEPPSIA